MNKILIRNLFYFFLFLLVLTMERGFGLPIFSLALAVFLIISQTQKWRLVPIVILGGLLAIVYMLPFTFFIALLVGIDLYLEKHVVSARYQSTQFFMTIMVANMIISFVQKYSWNGGMIAYHLCSVAFFFILTHQWFYRSALRQDLSFSQLLLQQRKRK